ncbi:hypothetical protein [Nostoc sp. CMAA1605]|nr:hypothetical protein [Nostoc sp. CMAA1605]
MMTKIPVHGGNSPELYFSIGDRSNLGMGHWALGIGDKVDKVETVDERN